MTWSRYAKLEAYETTAFNPHRGPVDPAACAKALGPYGGFWGWWIEYQLRAIMMVPRSER
jgi:hypothetical protein